MSPRGSVGSVWSWQSPPGVWLEVNPAGVESDVERMYASARELGMHGAAFVLLPAGQRPEGSPEGMDVAIVGRERPRFAPSAVAASINDAAWRAYFAAHPNPDGDQVPAVRAGVGAVLGYMAAERTVWRAADLEELAAEFERWAQR